MAELYIHCKYAITGKNCDRLIKDAGILVEDEKIIEVGKHKRIKKQISGHDKIERDNHIAIPILVNAHTHLPETLLRGICDNEKLEKWLYEYVWPFEMKLSAQDAYYGALLGCLELIESGIGGFIDQYFYVEQIKNAVEKAKIHALLCPSIFNNTPEDGSIENTWKNVKNRIQKEMGRNKDSLIKWGIGPHAPYTVPKDYLIEIKEFAVEKNIPIHIHLCETEIEVFNAKKEFGMTPIEYIDSLGLTEAKILGAHCVHTTKHEQEIMRKKNFIVLHNPQSNLKLASGIAPIAEYLRKNIKIAIGTDGNASNNDLGILEEITTMALLQKYKTNNPSAMPNSEIIKIASINGMNALGKKYAGIEKNSPASLTILTLENSHSWPQIDPISNIVFSSSSLDTNDVIVNGNIIYENKIHKTLNKEEIIYKCEKITQRIMNNLR
ncbi:MAG: amidohydrolase [Candidatus Heimdallarchaeaceae archaeon]